MIWAKSYVSTTRTSENQINQLTLDTCFTQNLLVTKSIEHAVEEVRLRWTPSRGNYNMGPSTVL